MSENTSARLRKDWMVDISIDGHEGHTRAKASLRRRVQGSVGIGLPDPIRPIATSMTSAMNWPSRALGRPGPTTDGRRHGARHRSRNPSAGDIPALIPTRS